MPDEVPAALPLLFLIAGIGAAPVVVSPFWTALGLVVVGLILAAPHPAFGHPSTPPHCVRLRSGQALLPADGGAKGNDDGSRETAIWWPLAPRSGERVAEGRVRGVRHDAAIVLFFFAAGIALGTRDQRRIAAEHSVEKSLRDRFVTIEAPIDRDWAARGDAQVLRCRRFTANGIAFDAPISMYASFRPPVIELQSTIRATGFLRASSGNRYSLTIKSPRLIEICGHVSPLAPSTWNRLASIRLRRYVESHPAEVAMIEALVLGRGERLSEEARQNFRRGGTYHLLVFSGMQIALAAALIAMMLRWAGSPRASDWSLLLFAVMAPLFIGPTASVSRSSIGIGLYALSRIARRPTSFENLWCFAAIVDLLTAPSDLTDPAFHLTYAGAGALIFLGKAAGVRWRWIAFALAAELAVVPLTLFHFHQYALGGSIMTILLTPIVFVMLIAGALFCIFDVHLLLSAISILNALCTHLNDLAAPASGFFAAPSAAALAAGLVCAIAAIAFGRGSRRTAAIAVALAIPTFGAIAQSVGNRSVPAPQVTFLNVGQGDAILVRSGRRSMLIDGGGRSDDTRFGESVLLPLLVDRGAQHVDVVVLSHPHPDHCGGLPPVLQQMSVGELWLNPRRFRNECAWILLNALRETDTAVRLIHDEQRLMLDETAIHGMVPLRSYRRAAENNSSVVVHVLARHRSVLLTGDIERDAEAEMSGRLPRAEVMKVPHHGSRSSTTAPLLDAVRPRIAVISCGARNWFGHPHVEVLRALKERDVRILRTDTSGAIEISLNSRVTIHTEIDTP